jgi:hypothetical protein
MRAIVSRPTLLRDIRENNPTWFSASNKRFFGDRSYYGYYGVATGEPYLVRSTYAWTDMLGGKRTLHYRINKLSDKKEILDLVDDIFVTLDDVKKWLRNN